MKKLFLLLLIILFSTQVVAAHQPRFTDGLGVVTIDEPEISKAFYAELANGESDIYKIGSEGSFTLLVNLLVPEVLNIETEGLAMTITDDNGDSIFESKKDSEWVPLHEPFANDNYFEGPAFEEVVSAGTYTITVSRTRSNGKYVLVTGKKEFFPINEIFHTIRVLPELKTEFFEKPLYTAYWNLVGVFILVSGLVLVGILIFFKKLIVSLENRV